MSLSAPLMIPASDIFDTGATELHKVGTLAQTEDGRLFRYAQAGGADLDPGKLCVAATQEANHANIAVAAAAAVGATEVTVTLGATAVDANDYANGYLVVNDADGEGILYLISGHAAANSAGTLVVKLEEPVQVALTTSSEVSLVRNPWKDAVISATDQEDKPVGVPVVAIPEGEFGWVQTRGLCSVLADEAVTAGLAVTTGTGVAGAVEAVDAAGEPIVGHAFQTLVDTEYRAVDLCLD